MDNVTETGKKHEVTQTTVLQDVLQLLGKIAIVLAVFAILFLFVFGMHRTEDLSMSPALKAGDLAVFYRLDKNYIASDVIVLKYNGETQVRRIIAIGGDTVNITEQGLEVNGALVERDETFMLYEDGPDFPIALEQGQVFVLGDNRRDAIDSRMYGAVNIKDTMGTVMTVIRMRNI